MARSDVLAVADHIKPGTAEQVLAVLSSFFNDAYEREIVTGNPARNRLRVTGGRRVRHRTPSDIEFMKLWRAFEKEGDPAFADFALLAFTGCRRREITHLLWTEVDLEAATAWLELVSRRPSPNYVSGINFDLQTRAWTLYTPMTAEEIIPPSRASASRWRIQRRCRLDRCDHREAAVERQPLVMSADAEKLIQLIAAARTRQPLPPDLGPWLAKTVLDSLTLRE